MPLMWAHAEYIKLLRSTADGRIVDAIPGHPVRSRGAVAPRLLEIWKPNRQVRAVRSGWTLRIQAPASFCLHWTDNDWQDVHDTASTPTTLGIGYVDLPIAPQQRAPIRFTFRWLADDRWEGRDYAVASDVG
jgi:glucoamylase